MSIPKPINEFDAVFGTSDDKPRLPLQLSLERDSTAPVALTQWAISHRAGGPSA
jgi:hypothetical protein